MTEANISVYHDTRNKKSLHGNFPVKLRVYYKGEPRLYPTGIKLTTDQFKRSYLSEKPRADLKNIKEKLIAIQARAITISKSLSKFDFTKFEKKLLAPTGAATDAVYYYKQLIQGFKKEERVKTYKGYECSLSSFQDYLKSLDKNPKGGKTYSMPFSSITVDFLKGYENWMLRTGKGYTTIGIYSRVLRTVFNAAIDAGEIDKDIYPFGKRKYNIPGGRKIKKALTLHDLKKLYEYKVPEDSPIYKARSFWFFSYQGSGMNGKDIAELKESSISQGSITFTRAKTRYTTKSDAKPIVVPITEYMQSVINKYGNKNRGKDDYVFPILNHRMSAEQRASAIDNFNRYINQHIKTLAKIVGVDENISNMYSRHSFSTIAIQQGASKEFVQDQLGHQSSATTENYFKGFEEKTKRQIAEKLMDFSIIDND